MYFKFFETTRPKTFPTSKRILFFEFFFIFFHFAQNWKGDPRGGGGVVGSVLKNSVAHGPHAPQKYAFLWRIQLDAPQKDTFLWRMLDVRHRIVCFCGASSYMRHRKAYFCATCGPCATEFFKTDPTQPPTPPPVDRLFSFARSERKWWKKMIKKFKK